MTRAHARTSAQWRKAGDPAAGARDDDRALQRSVDRVVRWFAERDSCEAVVARQLVGRPRPDDAATAGFMIRERRRRTRMDGSVDASLLRTVRTVGELLDLGSLPDDAPVVRTLGYVLSRQNAPGHFGEGCDAERHVSQLCSHHLTGFFSPGPRDDALAPLAMPTGVTIDGEEDARFVVSCAALRVVLRAGEDRRASVRQHVQCLFDIPGLWAADNRWPLDLQVCALGGVMLGPFEDRDRLDACVAAVTARQASDGSWPGGELFNVLDVLTALGTPTARQAVARSVPLVIAAQRDDGTWGGDAVDARALIGLRAMRIALNVV
jgi:hypothetical protein